MRILRLLVACVALTACADDPTTPVNVVGTWHLSAVDGQPLPVVLLVGDPPFEVCGGELTLYANQTFESAILYQSGDMCGQARFVESGTWTQTGPTALAFDAEEHTFEMTVQQSALLRVVYEGDDAVFRWTK